MNAITLPANTQPRDGKDILSDAKFYSDYSRFIEAEGRYETWSESVARVMNMHRSHFTKKGKMTPALERRLEGVQKAYEKKAFLGAQRALQFGGEQLLKHHARLYNCTSSYADRPRFFGEAFYLLLCGAGVGFSVQRRHVSRLPAVEPRTKQAKTFVIPDSIEGWAESLDVLMSSYFVDGGKHPEYQGRRIYFDPSQIRPKGAKISGGFLAPGPDPLMKALSKIEAILHKAAEERRQLHSIEVYDIVMHFADSVISGGVRRSATICLFDHDDDMMLGAKVGNWRAENPQRGRSNNSAVLIKDEVTWDQFNRIMTSVRDFGEPGFVFVDDPDITYNPCVEIGKYPQIDGVSGWQGCNLVEINGSFCETEADFYYACEHAAVMGTIQAAYTDFKFLDDVSKRIFDREALLGVSLTGWLTNPNVLLNEEIVARGVEIIRRVNREVAAEIGINQAARLTCVKPAGNASVILKTNSGVGPTHARRYIRNAQMNKAQKISQIIKENFPALVEESVWSANKTDWVISFPHISKPDEKLLEEIRGVKHLELIKFVQKHWVEAGTNVELCAHPKVRHNVSNTVTVDDWDEVAKFIYDNRHSFAGISLLGSFGDKDFVQAPYTAVKTAEEIVAAYGTGAMFASGLIVDGLHAFDNLWNATDSVKFNQTIPDEDNNQSLKIDWQRRFHKYADGFHGGDLQKAEYCLKDVHLLHRWEKIQAALGNRTIDWQTYLKEAVDVDIDTMAAQACAGPNGCAI